MQIIHALDRSAMSLARVTAILISGLAWSALPDANLPTHTTPRSHSYQDRDKYRNENEHCIPRLSPPRSHPYGQSLAEWYVQYSEWLALGPQEAQVFRHVLFPVVTDVSFTGSGTFEDPLVVAGHASFAVKAGTALFTPLLGWNAEIYSDGSTDPILPDDWFGTYMVLEQPLMIDGRAVVTDETVSRYYVPPQYLDPPFLYPQPTSYGSIGVHSFQGWGVLCRPLAVGVHEISFASAALVPPDNELFPYSLGQRLQFSFTITVVP